MRAVDRPEIAGLVSPFVPDRNAVGLEVGGVRAARQEPQQLVDYRFPVKLLGGQEREALGQIEAHLMAEQAQRAGARAVAALNTPFAHQTQKIEISLHRLIRFRGRAGVAAC